MESERQREITRWPLSDYKAAGLLERYTEKGTKKTKREIYRELRKKKKSLRERYRELRKRQKKERDIESRENQQKNKERGVESWGKKKDIERDIES